MQEETVDTNFGIAHFEGACCKLVSKLYLVPSFFFSLLELYRNRVGRVMP